MKINPLEHHTSLNCETGVMSCLLKNKQININDDLLFGIGAGLYFIYMPFVKIQGIPMFSQRHALGSILKNASKFLGLEFTIKKYPNIDVAMKALDDKIEEGTLVGLTGDLYYLNVYPEFVKIHFNGHNFIVYGKNEKGYCVSDPIVQELQVIPFDSIRQARFSKGIDNPKGKMYWLSKYDVNNIDLASATKKGITLTCERMLNKYFIFGGIKGIRFFAKKLGKYPKIYSTEKVKNYLTHYIRMQEIVGSGGSGYRIQYASFLKQAGEILNNPTISKLGTYMETVLVPAWRNLSVEMARSTRKNAINDISKFEKMRDMLLDVADKEENLFKELQKTIK